MCGQQWTAYHCVQWNVSIRVKLQQSDTAMKFPRVILDVIKQSVRFVQQVLGVFSCEMADRILGSASAFAKQFDTSTAGTMSCSRLCRSCYCESLWISLSPLFWHPSCDAASSTAVWKWISLLAFDIKVLPPDAQTKLCYALRTSRENPCILNLAEKKELKILEFTLTAAQVLGPQQLTASCSQEIAGTRLSPILNSEAHVKWPCISVRLLFAVQDQWSYRCRPTDCQKQRRYSIWTSVGAG